MLEESTCNRCFLDTYEVSRGFRKGIAFSKKLEKFKLIFKDLSKLKDGSDFEIIKKWAEENQVKDVESLIPLEFEVKLYTFS